MRKLKRVKITEDYITKELKKDFNYIKRLKEKVKPNELETGYILYFDNNKLNWFYLFPDKQILTNYLTNIPVVDNTIKLSGEKRNFTSLVFNTFGKKEKKKVVKSTEISETLLRKVFIDIGYVKEIQIVDKFKQLKPAYRPSVYEEDSKKQMYLSTKYTVDDAQEEIIKYYIKKFNEKINCKCVALKVKDKYFFLTEDDKVYNSYLRQLTVDEDGFVVMNRVKRKVEKMVKEFF